MAVLLVLRTLSTFPDDAIKEALKTRRGVDLVASLAHDVFRGVYHCPLPRPPATMTPDELAPLLKTAVRRVGHRAEALATVMGKSTWATRATLRPWQRLPDDVLSLLFEFLRPHESRTLASTCLVLRLSYTTSGHTSLELKCEGPFRAFARNKNASHTAQPYRSTYVLSQASMHCCRTVVVVRAVDDVLRSHQFIAALPKMKGLHLSVGKRMKRHGLAALYDFVVVAGSTVANLGVSCETKHEGPLHFLSSAVLPAVTNLCLERGAAMFMRVFSCPALKGLELKRVRNSDDDILSDFLLRHPDVQRLCVQGQMEIQISALNLRHLEIWRNIYSFAVDAPLLETIVAREMSAEHILQYPRLEHLRLRTIDAGDLQTVVAERTLKSISLDRPRGVPILTIPDQNFWSIRYDSARPAFEASTARVRILMRCAVAFRAIFRVAQEEFASCGRLRATVSPGADQSPGNLPERGRTSLTITREGATPRGLQGDCLHVCLPEGKPSSVRYLYIDSLTGEQHALPCLIEAHVLQSPQPHRLAQFLNASPRLRRVHLPRTCAPGSPIGTLMSVHGYEPQAPGSLGFSTFRASLCKKYFGKAGGVTYARRNADMTLEERESGRLYGEMLRAFGKHTPAAVTVDVGTATTCSECTRRFADIKPNVGRVRQARLILSNTFCCSRVWEIVGADDKA